MCVPKGTDVDVKNDNYNSLETMETIQKKQGKIRKSYFKMKERTD